MSQKILRPGFYSRPVQRMIEKHGKTSVPYACTVCGRMVVPIHKDGGWIPKNHAAPSGEIHQQER
jgi:hypothetical protein